MVGLEKGCEVELALFSYWLGVECQLFYFSPPLLDALGHRVPDISAVVQHGLSGLWQRHGANIVIALAVAVIGGQRDNGVDHVTPVIPQPRYRLAVPAQTQCDLQVLCFVAALARFLQSNNHLLTIDP